MKQLIVNADDFGLSSGANRAIIKAWQEGVLTSASLMPWSTAELGSFGTSTTTLS